MTRADRIAKHRIGLSSVYIPFYNALSHKLSEDWAPYSALRTFDQQTELWNQGRSAPGQVVTQAKAGESAHNYGCGSDWILWDSNSAPIWIKKEDPRWQEYINAVTSVGLRPGAEFGDIDHNEVRLGCDWPHVLIAYNIGGMTAAQQKIEESISCAALISG